MNMQNLMAQARKIQNEVQKITKGLEEKSFFFENASIKVEAKGNNKIVKFNIKDGSILEDKEMLEDLIYLGINSVLEEISKEKEEKLGKYTGGMGGLF